MGSWRQGWWLLTFALIGCASTAPDLKDATTGPIASLKFTKGYNDHYGVSGVQTYLVSKTPRCEDLVSAGSMLWTTTDERVSKVAANQRIVVLASTLYYVSRGWNLVAPRCDKRAAFTPLEGHGYSVTSHAPVDSECELQVFDETTGAPPPDLVVEDGAACLRAYQRELELGKKPAD